MLGSSAVRFSGFCYFSASPWGLQGHTVGLLCHEFGWYYLVRGIFWNFLHCCKGYWVATNCWIRWQIDGRNRMSGGMTQAAVIPLSTSSVTLKSHKDKAITVHKRGISSASWLKVRHIRHFWHQIISIQKEPTRAHLVSATTRISILRLSVFHSSGSHCLSNGHRPNRAFGDPWPSTDRTRNPCFSRNRSGSGMLLTKLNFLPENATRLFKAEKMTGDPGAESSETASNMASTMSCGI